MRGVRRVFAVVGLALALVSASCVVHPSITPPEASADRALWVWTSAQLLGDASAQRQLLAFARAQRVSALWMQVTTGRPAPQAPLQVSRAAEWRQLLEAAHAAHLRVEALDGDPVYAVAAFHSIPLQIADAVIDFNAVGAPAARFDGLHFDIEPYLLPAWHDRAAREQLLREYLDLHVEIQRRVHDHPPLTYGIDLPFWWHHIDPATGEALGVVTYRGIRRAASLHAAALIDAITVMDYRNIAGGADGLIALTRGLFAEADTLPHARIRVGVETSSMPAVDVWLAIGPLKAAIARTSGDSWRETFPGTPYPLRVFDDGQRVHLGMVAAPSSVDRPPRELLNVAVRYGVPSADPAGIEAEAHALAALRTDPEWRNARRAVIVDPASQGSYWGIAATNVPLQKITFAGKAAAMPGELRVASSEFAKHRSFAGLAIHDYDAFRTLTADVYGKRPPQ